MGSGNQDGQGRVLSLPVKHFSIRKADVKICGGTIMLKPELGMGTVNTLQYKIQFVFFFSIVTYCVDKHKT